MRTWNFFQARFLMVVSVAMFGMSLGAVTSAQTEIDKLNALDAAGFDDFGVSVSISGDAAVVGAPQDDDAGGATGAAYVYRFDGANWVQEAKLTALDLDNGDQFGLSVGISGDVIVIGSPRDDDFGGSSGSAYVFRFDGVSWNQEAKLNALDAASGDQFGTFAAIDGATVIIGAIMDDDTFNNSGSAYVFTFDGAAWSQQAKLVAGDPADIAQYGKSVAIEGDTAVVGAWQDDDVGFFTGSAYVYTRAGALWTQEQKLTADDPAQFRWFGKSVAISGDAILVGAYGDRGADLSESGGVYFFRKIGPAWMQQGNPNASDPAADDQFGWTVAISGDVALVGSHRDDDVGGDSGSVYVFRFDGAAWNEDVKVNASDGAAGDVFGEAVAMSGTSAIIGARFGSAPLAGASGAAYIFELGIPCPADLNGDGNVGSADFAILLGSWGVGGGGGIADLNGDGNVGSADLALLLGQWGLCA